MGCVIVSQQVEYMNIAKKGQELPSNKKNDLPYKQEKLISSLAFVCIQGQQTKELLHRSIVAFRFKNPITKNSFLCGSGVLLSHDIVLTAAHNLYEKNNDMQFQKQGYQVFEGVDGVAEAAHEVEDWRYLPEFRTCPASNKLQFDYAIIKLKPNQQRPITNDQFLELRPPCKCVCSKDPQVKLDIYGYPQYEQNYKPMNKQLTRLKLFQYGLTLSDSIVEVDPAGFKITYAVSTLAGQSGCPVVVNNQIIAIHTGANKKEENSNIGRLITQDLIRNVEEWRRQLKGSPFSLSEKAVCPHQQSQVRKQDQRQKKKIQEIVKEENAPKQTSKKVTLLQTSTATIGEAQQLKASGDKLKEEYKYELALVDYKKSMAIYEMINGKDSTKVAAILINGIGDIHYKQGKYSLALEAYERSKEIYEEKEGKESHNYAVSLERIGNVYQETAEHDSALDNYKRALVIKQKIKGKDSLETGVTINNIGLVYMDKGEYASALEYFKRSLQIYERAGESNTIEAAMSHNNIGMVYWNQKEYSLALQHYQKALEIKQSIKGEDSVDAADIIMNIGVAYKKQGDFPATVEMYKRAIAIYEEHQLRHRGYANAHHNLGAAYYQMEDYKSAAVAFRVSLPIFEQMGLSADMNISSLGLALCLRQLGEKGEQERVVKKYGVVL